MNAEPIDDIEAWSNNLSAWKRDCLRRLAISSELTDHDVEELLALVKSTAGFKLNLDPPAPVPFTKAHFGGSEQQPIILKGITNVANVNRLVENASLSFCPKALTVVFGRNGSGKSGFVRILRTACRTRVENPAKLKVLADVYGSDTGPQAAEIIIDAGAGEISIPWAPGETAAPQLMRVAVFDTASAQLYVDGGNQIRYLPFGLALPHRLNTVCLGLKERLEAERLTAVGNKVSLTAVSFPELRNTNAQSFEKSLNKTTTDTEIDTAARFDEEKHKRLETVSEILAASAASAADVAALATWVNSLAEEAETAELEFNDTALEKLSKLSASAVVARQAARLAASELFTDEPLPGIGSDSWRALWAAARDYSLNDAYVGHSFPVLEIDSADAACVLCQQPLLPDAAMRLHRFQKYMDDKLDTAASEAEKALTDAVLGISELKWLGATDFADRFEQIGKRDDLLADKLAIFKAAIVERRLNAIARLHGKETTDVSIFTSPIGELKALGIKLKEESEALIKANGTDERIKLVSERAELEDLKVLAANKSKLVTRRDLLVIDDAYSKAISETQTRGITQRANELLDTHLTKAVLNRFDAERAHFDIMHLKLGLARKSGQTKAEFEVNSGTKLTKVTSDILSEGEQRALALAGFLTEVALTDGTGPIIVDDPVSSLDRDRSAKVAERIAKESCLRQVVVFTHDIVFFNELCRAADAEGIEPVTIALFSDKDAAGKIDPYGMVWKGLTVDKRIKRLKNDVAPLAKLHATSPAEYEYKLKNLYGRLRDTYERVVEEVIFRDIVRRGVDVIQTQLLRYVRLSDELAIRFYEGMTRANTHSHDNPAADTVQVPSPDTFNVEIAELEKLVEDLRAESVVTEAARPQMKPKK